MAGCFGQLAAAVRPGLLRLNKWTAATRGNPLSAPDGDSRGPEGKEFQIKSNPAWFRGGGVWQQQESDDEWHHVSKEQLKQID